MSNSLNNPAGRLHALLSAYVEHAHRDKSVWQTWGDVFGVEDDGDLMPLLGEAAGLLADIEQAVERLDSPEVNAMHVEFSELWGRAIWSMNKPPRQVPSAGEGHVDAAGHAALGVLSVLLGSALPDGVIPDAQVLNDLRGEIQELIDSLLADKTLPQDVRSVLAQRMHDAAWAIDHIQLGGPEAVEAAMERLLGQIFLRTTRDDEAHRSSIFQRAMSLASKIYGVFLMAPSTEKALESWQSVYKSLPRGQ